jgi:septal ring factor EnvC (AmiA/AmiB activator)
MEIRKTIETFAIIATLAWLTYSYFIRDGDTAKQIESARAKADSVERIVKRTQNRIAELQWQIVRVSKGIDSLVEANDRTVRKIGDIEEQYRRRRKRTDAVIRSRVDSIKVQLNIMKNESSYYHLPFYYYQHEPWFWLLPRGQLDEGTG